MSHIYTQLTEAECAAEIRAICGEHPEATPEDYSVDQEPETPTQGELL